jgi:hypothetical protein
LKIGKNEMIFDKNFKLVSGCLLGLGINPTPNHITGAAYTLDINVVHDMLGHTNSKVLAGTAAKYGFTTENSLHV